MPPHTSQCTNLVPIEAFLCFYKIRIDFSCEVDSNDVIILIKILCVNSLDNTITSNDYNCLN